MSSDPSFLVAWIYQIEGTNTGSRVALWLAILAAFLHAVFGALQKGRHDPWLSRGAIDASSGLAMLPLAILVVPIPEPELWPIFLVIFLIHFIYKLLQAFAYSKGAFTVVYPVVRGTSPVFTVIGAYILFGETFSSIQWLGIFLLLLGIFGMPGTPGMPGTLSMLSMPGTIGHRSSCPIYSAKNINTYFCPMLKSVAFYADSESNVR